MEFIHNGLDLFFDFSDFGIQFADEADDVLQFKGIGRHPGTNRVSGCIADRQCHLLLVAALRGGFQKEFRLGQMGACNLLGFGELLQQGVDRGNVQRRHQVFQLRKQDTDQPGDRTFQFGPLFYFVKTVSG